MHFLLGVLEFLVREGGRISGSERPNFLFGSLGFHVWGPRIYVHVFAVFFMRGSNGTIWYILRIIPNPLLVFCLGMFGVVTAGSTLPPFFGGSGD